MKHLRTDSGGSQLRVTETTVFSSGSQLRRPRQFLRLLRGDFAVSRGVAWRLFLRDLRSRHRRSLLGYSWILLPPLVTAMAWFFLDQSGIVESGEGQIPYAVFVLAGTTLWQGFLDGLNAPFDKLTASQALITKFKLPAEAFILIGLADVLFNSTVRMALLCVVYLFSGVEVVPTVVLVPIGALALIGFGTALGALFAPLGTLYPDVQRAIGLITMVWFFVTPIVYSADKAGGLQRLNPVGVLIVTTRDWMFTGRTDEPLGFVMVLVVTLLMLPMAFVLYRLAAPYLVDRAGV